MIWMRHMNGVRLCSQQSWMRSTSRNLRRYAQVLGSPNQRTRTPRAALGECLGKSTGFIDLDDRGWLDCSCGLFGKQPADIGEIACDRGGRGDFLGPGVILAVHP